ncbi:hypothetical protein B0H11DRAFT_1900149 [Mycena galericulata]|nr:hypothetical protein B0H11DRAFT_1900149 [Mycena galericulata]
MSGSNINSFHRRSPVPRQRRGNARYCRVSAASVHVNAASSRGVLVWMANTKLSANITSRGDGVHILMENRRDVGIRKGLLINASSFDCVEGGTDPLRKKLGGDIMFPYFEALLPELLLGFPRPH